MRIVDHRSLLLWVLPTLLLVNGCSKPAPPPPPAEPAQPAAPTALPPGHPPVDMRGQTLPPGSASEAPNPQWIVPEGWKETPPGVMRRANFTIAGTEDATAEVVVSAFPGDVGGFLSNVNRWRGQIGLGPVSAGEADTMTSTIEINGQQVKIVDMTGPQRMIVVIIPHDGDSWFFKMTGAPALVEAQKDNLITFVKSVKW